MLLGIEVLLEAIAAFLIGTIVFDIIHVCLHRCLKSPHRLLRRIGRFHSPHHRFFTAKLMVNTKWIAANLWQHSFLEYSVQMIATLFCSLFFSPFAIFLAIIFETLLFVAICYWRGADPHHQSRSTLSSYRGGIFVSTEYHALHHIHPDHFYSGYVKIIDYVLGTSLPLAGKKIAMTGASGALGSAMKKLLEKEGAIVTTFKFGEDYNYAHYEKLIPSLTTADILFLCHGSKFDFAQEANCDSFIHIIELFKQVHPPQLLPLEIWGVGSEIECHPCFGIKKIQVYAKSKRNYAKSARRYFHDPKIQYRHLVHSAFISRMGYGLMTANFAAKISLFFLKRGFKYIPVSYMGFAYINYLRFVAAKYR